MPTRSHHPPTEEAAIAAAMEMEHEGVYVLVTNRVRILSSLRPPRQAQKGQLKALKEPNRAWRTSTSLFGAFRLESRDSLISLVTRRDRLTRPTRLPVPPGGSVAGPVRPIPLVTHLARAASGPPAGLSMPGMSHRRKGGDTPPVSPRKTGWCPRQSAYTTSTRTTNTHTPHVKHPPQSHPGITPSPCKASLTGITVVPPVSHRPTGVAR